MSSPRTLTKKQLTDALNRGESLIGCDMRGGDFSGVCFDRADLTGAKLAECNLSRATFRDCTMVAASLWHSDCRDAVFDRANLEEADLDFANIDGCTFHNAKVKKAIFSFHRVTLESIMESVRTGGMVRMETRGSEG